MPAFESPTADGNSTQQHAPPFQLEDLPGEAVVLLAGHASSPATPAACLLPLVCRGWQAVASRVQLLVDIRLDLAPTYRTKQQDTAASGTQQAPSQRNSASSAATPAAEAAPAAASAAPAAAPAVLRGRQLAAWLAKHMGSVRSLVILPLGNTDSLSPGWEQDLASIRDALTVPQHGLSTGIALPHLVQLELPVLGLRGTSAFLQALTACMGLQQLSLRNAHGDFWGGGVGVNTLRKAVAPLTKLRALRCFWGGFAPKVEPKALARLLRALPPSLEDLRLMGLICAGSVPLSCFTHLVNLRALRWPVLWRVEDDSSSSTTTTTSSSSTSSSSHRSSSASGLTALTRLYFEQEVASDDARLRLPNVRALEVRMMMHVADPAVWQQLQGMPHLQQLDLRFALTSISETSTQACWLG